MLTASSAGAPRSFEVDRGHRSERRGDALLDQLLAAELDPDHGPLAIGALADDVDLVVVGVQVHHRRIERLRQDPQVRTTKDAKRSPLYVRARNNPSAWACSAAAASDGSTRCR